LGSVAALVGAALVGGIAGWVLARAFFAVETERSNEDLIDAARRATLAEVRLSEERAAHQSLIGDHARLVEQYEILQGGLTVDLTDSAMALNGGMPDVSQPAAQTPAVEPPVNELNSRETNVRSRVADIARRTMGDSAAEDDLQAIRGVGPKINGMLRDMGFSSFQQIASLTPDDLAELTAALDSFPGRIERDDWVGSAASLYAEKYGDGD
jgi:predicted flap endonuclease-1-like 5' DNA nuclease